MEFIFDTVYDQKAVTAMAHGLRKTIRKKHSRRSHVFGWLVIGLVLLLTLPLDGETLVIEGRTIITWTAGLVEAYPFREGRVYEDNEAVCRWVCGAGKLARVKDGMYYYRTNPVSTTQRSFSLKKRDYLWALDSIIRYYHSLGYGALTRRFCGLYVEEAAGQYRRFGAEVPDPRARQETKAAALSLVKAVPMTMEQKEILLDAFHPKLIRYYWPVAGAVRTLKNSGLTGLAAKLKKNLKRGG